MTDLNRSAQNDSSIDSRFDRQRRRVLQTLGAGMGAAAITGLGSAHSMGSAKIDGVARTDENASGDEIHPIFGFSALSSDVEPPDEADHEVQVLIREREDRPIPEFFFEPTGLYIDAGDTVRFNYVTPHHSITAYHPGFGYVQRVPDGVPPFSSPLLPVGAYHLRTFDHEGVYEMHCAPHEVFGHAMRIVVEEVSGPAAEPLPDLCAQPSEEESSESEGEGGGEESEGPELRLPAFTAYTVLTDSALDPERIVEQGSVNWEEIDDESKRLFLQLSGFPPCGEEP